MRIDWTVFGPDGTTLGGVSQTRIVRKGSLDRKWGPAADAAARAAAMADRQAHLALPDGLAEGPLNSRARAPIYRLPMEGRVL